MSPLRGDPVPRDEGLRLVSPGGAGGHSRPSMPADAEDPLREGSRLQDDRWSREGREAGSDLFDHSFSRAGFRGMGQDAFKKSLSKHRGYLSRRGGRMARVRLTPTQERVVEVLRQGGTLQAWDLRTRSSDRLQWAYLTPKGGSKESISGASVLALVRKGVISQQIAHFGQVQLEYKLNSGF